MFNYKAKINRKQSVLTVEQYRQLVANHHANKDRSNTTDFHPVVKFFNPVGAATWLFSELDPETGIAYGLGDIGQGCVEYGYTSLQELIDLDGKLRFRMSIERDYHFKGEHPMSHYKEKGDAEGRLVA